MFKRRQKPPVHLPTLAELRDVDSPSVARRIGAEFGREAHFASDLRRVRPWLPAGLPGRELPTALLDSEWIGFLALLGEGGPWVYVQSVRELQELSRLYSQFFRVAVGPESEQAGDSLAARLGVPTTPELELLETEFWQHAAELAFARHAAWSASRR